MYPGQRSVAVRVAGLDQPAMLEQWWQMTSARNLSEFERALRRLQVPMFNVIYADVAGHILYVFNGRVPKRPHGDVGYWTRTVAGDSSTTLWTETRRDHAARRTPRYVLSSGYRFCDR